MQSVSYSPIPTFDFGVNQEIKAGRFDAGELTTEVRLAPR